MKNLIPYRFLHTKVNMGLVKGRTGKKGQQEALIMEAALCRGYGWSLFPAVDVNSGHTKEEVMGTLILTDIEPLLTVIHLVLSLHIKADI